MISIPITWENGEVGRVPFDELDFKNEYNEFRSAVDYPFSEWVESRLYAHYEDTGLQQVTLAAEYCGAYVSINGSEYPVPVEHLTDISLVWGLPLFNCHGKGMTWTDEQKQTYGLPTGNRPPFPTRLYALDGKLDKFIPVDPAKENLIGKLPLFDHPCLDTPAPWPFGICKMQPEITVADEFAVIDEAIRPQFNFISACEFLQDSIQIDWFIDKLIPRNSTGQLFGPSGGGKTFNAVDISLATAVGGTTLNGHRVNKGLVLYLAGEGHDGLRRRIRAWQLHHNKVKEDLALFYLSRNTINFDSPDVQAAINEGNSLTEQHGTPVALIVIDTLARHLEGDENNARDMGAFIKEVDRLRNSFPGSVAIIVHHSGHGEDTRTRARGSSALKGAMDFEFCCDKGLLTVTKMKDGETPSPIEFTLRPVKIGVDDDGEPVTSCVIQYGERSAKNREAELTAAEKMLFGMVNDYPNILSGDLRTAFSDKRREREPDAKQDTLKKAFNRALDGLIGKKLIFMDGNIVKAGQGTKAGHSGTCPERVNGTDRDTPLKGVLMSRPLVLSEVLTLNESDFEGADL